ncbi:MAG: hypothetical protein ACFB9N_08185 [Geitlerinemataceae cyanobacterium]
MTHSTIQRAGLGLLSIAAVSLAACGQTAEGGYPQNAVDNFTEGCLGSGFDFADEICSCTIDKIQANYSFDEFKEMNEAVNEGGELPIEMLQLTGSCYSEIAAEKGAPPYPAQVTDNILDGCMAGSDGNEQVAAACACGVEQVQETYTFSEFMAIDRAATSGEEPPAEFQEIWQTCFEQAG